MNAMSQTENSPKHRGQFADRALLVGAGLAFSALFLGAIWLMNKTQVLGPGNGVLFLILAVEFVYSRIRIRELEKKLKEKGG